MDIVTKMTVPSRFDASKHGACDDKVAHSLIPEDSLRDPRAKREKQAKMEAFDRMNTVAAHMLTNLTSSMRFDGSLNIDLNEITMNLVPYPRLKFLVGSLSPLVSFKDMKAGSEPRSIDQMFSDAFNKDHMLIKVQ